MSSADADGTLAALGTLAGPDADLVLPGHGEPWRGPVARAVDEATASTG